MPPQRGNRDAYGSRLPYNGDDSPYSNAIATPSIAHRTRGQRSPSSSDTVGRMRRSSHSTEGDVNGPQPTWEPTIFGNDYMVYQGGNQVHFELHPSFEKSFFLSEETHDWTCYRRNYFATRVAYSMHTNWQQSAQVPSELEYHGTRYQIENFAVCIRAVVDDAGGKEIPIVVHTPKRDKGPQTRPAKVALLPKAQYSDNAYGGYNAMAARHPYHQPFETPTNLPTEHFYERLQFKNATQNNGKRRAAQQHYHVIAELYADLGPQSSMPDRYFRMATKMSHRVVVRGRSPGHYKDNARKDQNRHQYNASDDFEYSRSNEEDFSSGVPHGLPMAQNFMPSNYDHRTYQTTVGYQMGYSQYSAVKPPTPAPSDDEYRHAVSGPPSQLYYPGHTLSEYSTSIPPGTYNPYQPGSTPMLPSTPGTLFSPPSSYRDTRANSHTSVSSMGQPLSGPPSSSMTISMGSNSYPSQPSLNYEMPRSREEMEGRQLPLLPLTSSLASSNSLPRFDDFTASTRYAYPPASTFAQDRAVNGLPLYNPTPVHDPTDYGQHSHPDGI